jgi:hypothetical protein
MTEAFNKARLKVNRLKCQRADWPTIPNPPDYRDNENFESYKKNLIKEKEIRESLPKISPCQGGLCNGPSCVSCSKTECEGCVLDKATPKKSFTIITMTMTQVQNMKTVMAKEVHVCTTH